MQLPPPKSAHGAQIEPGIFRGQLFPGGQDELFNHPGPALDQSANIDATLELALQLGIGLLPRPIKLTAESGGFGVKRRERRKIKTIAGRRNCAEPFAHKGASGSRVRIS